MWSWNVAFARIRYEHRLTWRKRKTGISLFLFCKKDALRRPCGWHLETSSSHTSRLAPENRPHGHSHCPFLSVRLTFWFLDLQVMRLCRDRQQFHVEVLQGWSINSPCSAWWACDCSGAHDSYPKCINHLSHLFFFFLQMNKTTSKYAFFIGYLCIQT